MHEKHVEIRWRDIDAYDHVNNAVYLTYLEECRDEWLERALGNAAGSSDFVIARIAIDYRRELRLEDKGVVVRCRLARIGTSSVRTEEEIRTIANELAAEAAAVIVARDPGTGGSRALRSTERKALESAG
jgi:acyl-CoA thioester hydrolase